MRRENEPRFLFQTRTLKSSERTFHRTAQWTRDGWLWKIITNQWNKKPRQNTDDAITLWRDGMRIMSDVPAGGRADPRLCEIRRIFGSSVLKPLSQNPGKQFIPVATQLSGPRRSNRVAKREKKKKAWHGLHHPARQRRSSFPHCLFTNN